MLTFLKATKIVASLEKVPTVVKAKDGVKGKSKNLDGSNGTHKIVDVPLGTVFRNLKQEILAELTDEGEMFIAARGGAGGRGNVFFKSSTRQCPELAEEGGKGEKFSFELGNLYQVGFAFTDACFTILTSF